jgi:hypothetical protein
MNFAAGSLARAPDIEPSPKNPGSNALLKQADHQVVLSLTLLGRSGFAAPSGTRERAIALPGTESAAGAFRRPTDAEIVCSR